MVRRLDGSLTPAEHAVMEVLRVGPALLAARTDGPARLVDSRTTRALARAGLIVLDHGEARLQESPDA